ncbi:sugar ABC transporter ATP-binding protein [Veillonellaceae bacterium WCA-693-APC-5D-A]|uniref:Sugar ABC transporter ATP-binding protein n=2 Tax=Anaerovibrio slackiae TaxID=2652309 RepID=A0A6I2UBB5_9FIRM|nr:sugar ABC transporter ATP-binding protein [Anaerovibrio slackiae]MCI6098305.1 sugar ABC transporter ATP-binding protein [Selenomonadaceae bacterium]MDD6163533.1 sugar ABC transporter ATP-binding protein [Anaerovibrio slackiae]MSU08017.1 sugar ABC transporter ATP-binding protein [Anaerovibrio slackiae]
MAAALLEMRNIDKVFPGVRALSNVDFTLHAGEIHSLMGENGAGKSTLVKVLTGVYPKDGGTIHLNGREISPKTPKEAQEEGISTVYQEVNLCPNLTVAENIFIGREPRRFGFIDWKEVNRRSVELLQKLDVDIDVNKTLDNYPVAIQQMVAIARAVDVDAKILILDEPTSSLNEGETARLFKIVRQLQKQGMGIIFISHFLEQIYELCDHITILRNGELVGSYELAKLPRLELIARMVGKDLNDVKDMDKMAEKSVPSEEVFIETDHAASIGQIKDVSLQIHKGEVIGFAGLLGSGRTETAEMLFGLKDVTGGQLKINGKAEKLANPMAAMKDGIAFCPEDRKLAGIIGDLTVRENIILALQAMDGMFTHIPYSEQVKLADQFIEKLRIKVSDRDQLIKNLSGGNQQKVIIARWLATHPQFLILDEPTRGIDVGTKTEIQKMAVELAKTEGMSVAFISSEMDEMVRTCSKLIVMRDRKKVAELTGEQVSSDGVMQAIAGGDN